MTNYYATYRPNPWNRPPTDTLEGLHNVHAGASPLSIGQTLCGHDGNEDIELHETTNPVSCNLCLDVIEHVRKTYPKRR